jgi:hypothetical protein
MEGLEPPHLAASDPKSDVSTNFTTSGLKWAANVRLFIVSRGAAAYSLRRSGKSSKFVDHGNYCASPKI